MKTACVYARVSTEAQEERGSSLTTQVEGCLAKAKEAGYGVPQDYIVTESFTGALLPRPELDRVRRWVQGGEVEAVFNNYPLPLRCAGSRFCPQQIGCWNVGRSVRI